MNYNRISIALIKSVSSKALHKGCVKPLYYTYGRLKMLHVFFFQAPPATDPVVQWSVQWPDDITILNRARVQGLCRATPEGGYTRTPKSPRN